MRHQDDYYLNVIFSALSPDGKRTLKITEYGVENDFSTTQVTIDFEKSGGGVYATSGTNLGIKAYWKDNNTVVIETKKEYIASQKWEHAQRFNDKVMVEYIEI